ncbi:PadR family transcriptional regulator [Microbacterium oleivorans]|uniref:Helix-turn-helix transcriptional regulator n=1 Tax=Microbacterium oleivorans TaxID=273677 RepID=A0A7D5EST1_9MICO|nr:helix-turn-helix transcriptional regulator [Microbacterium oleivorans]QLD12285.1 helix-turn-helix transcriptional regulator [Microbacterium oleivorans]
MQPLRRITPATVDVLRVLIGEPGPVWGLLVIGRTDRPAGSVYPILERLESLDWVRSEWETDAARSGPRRRFYALTDEGIPAARAAVAAFELRAQRREAARSRGADAGAGAAVTGGATGVVATALGAPRLDGVPS